MILLLHIHTTHHIMLALLTIERCARRLPFDVGHRQRHLLLFPSSFLVVACCKGRATRALA